MPDFAVELVSGAGGAGRWHRTDWQGRLTVQPPSAGRWMLRGVDLRLSTTAVDTWESRFISLTFDVAQRPVTQAAALSF